MKRANCDFRPLRDEGCALQSEGDVGVLSYYTLEYLFVLHELTRKLIKSYLFRFVFLKFFYLVCVVVSVWLLETQIQIFTTFSIFKVYYFFKSDIWILY